MAAKRPRILKSAAALELLQVRTVSGARIGHVFDFRLRTDRGAAPVVEAILYGSRGLLSRLGIRHARPTEIEWSRVRAVEDDAIVVDDDAPRVRRG